MAVITDAKYRMEEMFIGKNFDSGSITPHIGIADLNGLNKNIKKKFDDNAEDDATIEIEIKDRQLLHHSHTHFLLSEDGFGKYKTLWKFRAYLETNLGKNYLNSKRF